jgi:hypothetical protein
MTFFTSVIAWMSRSEDAHLRKMDIFDTKEKRVKRKFKRSASRKSHVPHSEMYIRMVLPAEQTTAIAKSMLERQSKPKVTLIDLELQRMKEVSETRKRKGSRVKLDGISNKSTKKPRQRAPSASRKPKQTSKEDENVTTIGQVLN